METVKLIKDKFAFLTEKKFKCKTLQKNSEIEVVFFQNDFQFEFVIDNYKESLDVVVSKGKQRVNIVDFQYSEKNKASTVQQAKNIPGLYNKINVMSQFINVNLFEFMQR